MRINEKEIFFYSNGYGDKDGRVFHKVLSNSKESSLKERWIKLKGNILFFFKINEDGGVNNQLPHSFLTLELFKVEHYNNDNLPFAFSITFETDLDKKYIFSCINQAVCDDWVRLLKEASYQSIKQKIKHYKQIIKNKTGKEPFSLFFDEPLI